MTTPPPISTPVLPGPASKVGVLLVNLGTPDQPRRVNSAVITSELMPALGVAPIRGRQFTREDTLPGAEDVAVLSSELWTSAFGRDESIVGRTVPIDGATTRIVGIMPPGYDVHDQRVAVWLPLTLDPATPRALVARAGLDVVRLRAGLERLSLYAMGQPTITPDDVREAVPAGPEAHTDFGIANAIQRNDVREALREVGRSLDSGMVPFFILGQLRIAAQRLPARRVKSAVEAVFRTDIALKSSGGDPRILIERLVVEMCEGRRA